MEYETILSEYVDYGRNKFIEVSKKRVMPDNAVFLNISKGYYTPEGERRYQRGIGFPPEADIVNGLIEKLQVVVQEGGVEGAAAEEDPNADLED
jgi:hypothetical protein